MRILVADDSIVSRHVLDSTLRKWGYEVVVACDGVEAWKVLGADDAPSEIEERFLLCTREAWGDT